MKHRISIANTQKRIRRFLRRSGSGNYFKDGGWTDNPDEATSFSDAVEAAETCIRYRLTDVELALRYEQGSSDVFCTQLFGRGVSNNPSQPIQER